MPSFFIDRPIFAWVVAILISLGGVLAILNLGVESYPNIAPPQVTVNATYPGASADTTTWSPAARPLVITQSPPLMLVAVTSWRLVLPSWPTTNT